MVKKISLFLLLIVLSLLVVAQENIALNRDVVFALDKYVNRKECKIFTALKPYNKTFVEQQVNIDSALTPGCKKAKEHEPWIKRKLFREDLFIVNYDNFHLYVDPLFVFSFGRSFGENKNIYTNTRGIQIKGNFGNKIFFITSYYETQSRFPDYIATFTNKYEVAPGQGRVKNFKNNAFDYGTSSGLISYSPNKHLNFQFGFDKNFIGDGYRSLLLSDNAYQSPFLKIYLNYGWFYYQTIFTSFQNLNTDSVLNAPDVWYHGYQTKPATFNYAGFRIGKHIELGLFEGIVFEASAKNKKFNYNSLNPIIFVNTIQYSLFDDNNSVIGMTFKYKPLSTLNFYGQLMLDNLSLKKLSVKGYQGTNWGFQLGGKWYDMFGIPNFTIQVEYNQVSPYSYSHPNPLQSYTHYNQSLTHPLGANFKEVVAFMNYRYRRIFAEMQLNYAMVGLDTNNSDWGQNIFRSQLYATHGYKSEGNSIAQGVKTKLIETGLRVCYVFNPKTNLQVEAGCCVRKYANDFSDKMTSYIYFGLKTSLTNRYHDF
ncbi:MAG: hypothetical protein WCQ95_11345 [Bacteroidota bacterium]